MIMIANWFYNGGDSWWQIVRYSCCRVGDPHSTDFPPPFFSPFIDFLFHPFTFKALRLLYLLDNDATRPVLTQPLHHMTHFT
jgi:hypothetical protein